jgi:hypothetical protein
MPGFTLSTVPADIHLEIIRHLLGCQSRCQKTKDAVLLKDLSLVCRSFNDACGAIIFRKYHLDLSQAQLSVEAALFDGSAMKRCDVEAVCQRLSHLERKAPFVRKLRVTVQSNPIEIRPLLCATVQKLRGLSSVHLISGYGSTLLDVDLWNRLVDVTPATLSLKGSFHTPDGLALQPIGELTSLKIGVYRRHTKAVVDVDLPHFCSAGTRY